jgi:cytoskeletal protein CcmA (bactofilin family)
MPRGNSDLSVIGSSTKVTGRVSGDGGLRVEGAVKGDVAVTGPLEVAEGATIEGNVRAESLDLSGALTGDVAAQGLVIVRSGAAARGELKGSQVAIEPGSRVSVRLECEFELDLGSPSPPAKRR